MKHRVRTIGAALLAALFVHAAAGSARSAELTANAIQGWDDYISRTELRIANEIAGEQDVLAGTDAEILRRRLENADEVVVTRISARTAEGGPLRLEGALVHHWQGAVFVPGATLAEMLTPTSRPAHQQDDLEQSRVLSRSDNETVLFVRLQKRAIVRVTLDTIHHVRTDQIGPSRARRISRSLRVAEVDGAGTPDEREKPIGRDRGFLWRLNSYWRYEQTPSGVLVECESVSLSRNIPFGLRLFVQPLVERTSRESMIKTLEATRRRFAWTGTRTSSN